MKLQIQAWTKTPDGFLTTCDVKSTDAVRFDIHGIPGVPQHMKPEFEDLGKAQQSVRLLEYAFEGGIKEGKRQVREALGI